MPSRPTARRSLHGPSTGSSATLSRWLSFHEAEEGTHALEALLVIAFTVVPCFWALLLLEEVLAETLGLEVVVLTSPFF